MNRSLVLLALSVFALAALAVVASFIASTSPGDVQPRQRIVLGATLPLTGNLSYDGVEVQRGLTLAIDRYNHTRDPDDPFIDLRIEDNRGRPQEAVAAFHRLVDLTDAFAIVSIFTPLSKPLVLLSDEKEVILYATVTSVTDFAKGHAFVFRDFISLRSQCNAIAQYFAETGIVTVASLTVNDDYGRDALRLCWSAFESRGVACAVGSVFTQDETDLRTPLSKILVGSPEALFIVGRERSLANAVVQTRQLGFRGVIACLNGFDSPNVFEIVSDLPGEVVFTSTAFSTRSPETAAQKAFVDEYRSRYANADPHQYAVFGFCAGYALCESARDSPRDLRALANRLEAYSAVDIAGRVQMNASHDTDRPARLYRFVRGGVELLDVPPDDARKCEGERRDGPSDSGP